MTVDRSTGRVLPWLLLVTMLASACASSASTTHGHPAPPATHHHHVKKHHHHHHKKRHHVPAGRAVSVVGVPRGDLPRRSLTPGVVLSVSRSRICVAGYSASVRDVPSSESDAVYRRYRVVHVPYAHEVDHLISLELGGSNAIANLWPEPYAGRWGARTKDALENRLHALVCSGQLALPVAQHMEATNWVAAYRRFIGPPP
jgi:5-methylcytosine-specific restriction endonuclease McrA